MTHKEINYTSILNMKFAHEMVGTLVEHFQSYVEAVVIPNNICNKRKDLFTINQKKVFLHKIDKAGVYFIEPKTETIIFIGFYQLNKQQLTKIVRLYNGFVYSSC